MPSLPDLILAALRGDGSRGAIETDRDIVLLACSGGMDSQVLLHVAASVLPRERLVVAHVHHGLQPQAEAWLDFCRQAASVAGLAFLSRRLPPMPARPPGGIEAWARAGRYRALVKGHSATTLGKFKLTVMCTGAGCFNTSCVFGQTYGEIFDNPALTVINKRKITAVDVPMLVDYERQHLVDAVKQSSHTDVTTPEEAITRVDQQEMNITYLAEPAAQRMFVAFEYGAGDNSYGAIFSRTDGSMVTNIHDGDLERCTVSAETCLLSDDWSAMRMDPAFTRISTRVITSPSQLDTIETAQALDTFARSYRPDAPTVAEGLAMADGNQLNIVRFRHDATGTRVDVFEHGAGDTSVGVIFYAGQLRHAGTIDDLAIENCTLFAN